MVDLSGVYEGLQLLVNWRIPIVIFLGVALGIIFGAIPGLTGSMGIAIAMPMTFYMNPIVAITFLISIYTGGNYGGSISAILINTPGSPASAITGLDGFPMTKKGMANEALGIATMSSAVGGLIGAIFLFFVMRPLAQFALKFGPSEMFMLAIFALTVIASLKGKSLLKGLAAGLFGILLGTIGTTPTGVTRGTFGIMYLMDGIPIICALIGFLAISELFRMLDIKYIQSGDTPIESRNLRKLWKGALSIFKYYVNIIRSSLIGIAIGVLPAAGSTVANILAYNETKRWSKNPDSFGEGNPEGVIAGETANNASQGGAMAIMLALGIPGSAATAMLIGALMLHNLLPGPRLFLDHMPTVYAVLVTTGIEQFVLLAIGLFFCFYAATVITVPTMRLVPAIIMFAVIGSFVGRNLMFDAQLLLIFGLMGWFMKRNDYPVIATVLGIILGPIADNELIRVNQIFSGNYLEIFTRPVTLALLLMSIGSLSYAIYSTYFKKRIVNKRRD